MSLPSQLSRYGAVARLFLRHRSALKSTDADAADAESLATDLEKLGPTFIKLGQLLSTRSDLLPPAYLEALSRLQDKVDSIPVSDVMKVVEDDLGVRILKAFSSFDPEPLASASLGQVHRATLRDGRPVAVKVQRPGLAELVKADLDALDDLARFVDNHTETGRLYEFAPMVREFRKALMVELDYKQEATHLKTLSRNLSGFQRIIVPAPVEGYVSTCVLTMDYVQGTKVTTLSPVTLIDLDPEGLAEELIRAYLQQILIDGFFHADPHPGNVFITDDGCIALLDLGMVGHVSPSVQDKLLKLVLAIGEGNGEEAADEAVSLGAIREGFDEAGFTRDVVEVVGRYHGESLANIQTGQILLEVNRSAGMHGMVSPVELTMLGKALLNLDHIARSLAPSLDVNAAIRRNASSLMHHRLLKNLSPGAVFSRVLDAKDLAQQLPKRINRVLESLASSQLKLKVELIDEGAVIDGLQKVANRITLGLILAALIVSAAMMMQIESRFTLLGYPGFPTLLFMVAGSLGLWLVVNIVTHDRTPRTRK